MRNFSGAKDFVLVFGSDMNLVLTDFVVNQIDGFSTIHRTGNQQIMKPIIMVAEAIKIPKW